MKFIRALITALFFLAVLGLVGVFIFVEFKGKSFIEQGLSRKLNRPVSVSSVRLVFPVGLRLDDLSVKGVMKADEVRVILGMDFVFRQEPVLAHVFIRHPEFALMKTKDTALSICLASQTDPAQHEPLSAAMPSEPGNAKSGASSTRPLKVSVDDLTIENGMVEYFDFTREKPFQLSLKDIQLNARDITFPARPVKIKFSLKALLEGKDIPLAGSTIDAKGWIDLPAKDMQATLDVVEPNGRLGLSSVLEAVHNDLTIRGKVDLSGNAEPKQDAVQDKDESLDKMIIGAIGNSGIRFAANFAIKTKLDDIQIDAIAFGGEVNVGSEGGLKENLKNIGKQFEAIGKKLTETPQPSEQESAVNAVTPQPVP